MNQEQYISNQADQIIRQHSNPNEVDALNSILNNINVSTKNNNNYGNGSQNN